MRIIGVEEFGGPSALSVLEVPEPHAGPGEIRIAVKAIAVNPTDTLSRSGQGRPMPGPPYVVGMDAAGVVDEVGSPLDGVAVPFAVGDEVMAITLPAGEHKGAYAEYVVGPWESATRIPTGVSLEAASTLPMNGLTAVQALEKLALTPGSTIAVTGAAGTLGAYVVQLAKDAGLTVIADSSAADRALVEGLGADVVVERGDDVADRILAAVPGGVDAVVDAAVQKDVVVPAVAPGGAFVSFRGWDGSGSSATAGSVRFVVVSVGDEYRSHEKLAALADAVSRGAVTLRVADVLPAGVDGSAASAHERLEAGGTRGRFVLVW